MKVIFLAGVFAASTAFGAHATGTKLTQAECDTLWNQANPSGAATITQAQAQPYVTDFKAANSDGDSTLDQKEFAAACKNGHVKGTGSSGAATGEPSDEMAPLEKMLQTIRAGVSTNLRECQRSWLLGIFRSRPFLISEARRRDDLLDIGDRRCRNRIGHVVSFQGEYHWSETRDASSPA